MSILVTSGNHFNQMEMNRIPTNIWSMLEIGMSLDVMSRHQLNKWSTSIYPYHYNKVISSSIFTKHKIYFQYCFSYYNCNDNFHMVKIINILKFYIPLTKFVYSKSVVTQVQLHVSTSQVFAGIQSQ